MVFDRFEGLTLAANPLREYLGSSAIGIKSVQRSTRMTMKFTKGQEAEAGVITALLGYSSIHTATGLSYLIRNSGFLHNVEQLKRERWDKLLWIDCGPLDDGTGRHLLTYLLGSETREIERVELQVLIDGAAHWHSVSHLFAGAEQLEQALVERFCIRLSQEPGIVELAQNRVDTKLTGQDSGVKSTVHSSKTGE